MKNFLMFFTSLFSLCAKLIAYTLNGISKLLMYRPKISGAIVFSAALFVSYNFLTKQTDQEIVNQVVSSSSNFGIDVSQNQGDIDWKKVLNSKHPIEFVIIRSTMGDNRQDTRYWKNVEAVRNAGLQVGTYHYYDPNENSTKQANNFIKNSSIRSGDFVPIVDIERIPRKGGQSIENLRKGLRNFMKIVEDHYGEKPIIYTGLSYYSDHLLKHDFGDYPKWLAAYDPERRNDPLLLAHANIFQFSEKVRVEGITANTVDGNDIIKDTDSLYMP